MMDTKIIAGIIDEMISETEKIGKDKKAADKILALNKKLKAEIEK